MRNFPDWITAYLEYAAITESPKRLHFWTSISCVAGALRRRVWIDQKRFMWYPSFYIIFVAPPGVVSKSTTIDIGMSLLKEIPGIKFGPNAVTWQALVTSFSAASEMFPYNGEFLPMSALTLEASELGSLLDLKNGELINLLIELWDGKRTYEKLTKMSGNDMIECPWINIIAATTPHWVSENMPQAMIGGGLSSRCIFIFSKTKEEFIAYVDERVEEEADALKKKLLIHDLEMISQMTGPFTITPAAREWGRAWYEQFWRAAETRMDSRMLEGYAARKQTHLHKLAMVISASLGASMIIERENLELAETLLIDVESDMHKVFERMGRSPQSLHIESLVALVRRIGPLDLKTAYAHIHAYIPDFSEYERLLSGAIQAGYLILEAKAEGMSLRAAP